MSQLSKVRAIAGFVLAIIFGYSAFRKIDSPGATEESLREFGVPSQMSKPFYWSLIGWEGILSVGLMLKKSRRIAGFSSVVTLVLFTGAIVSHLIKGQNPRCGCFGGDSSSPVGKDTVARNSLLVAIGVAASGLSLQDVSAARRVFSRHWLSAVVLVQGFLLIRLLRQFGMIIQGITQSEGEGLKQGDSFDASASEQKEGIEAISNNFESVSILFLSEGCNHCEKLASGMLVGSDGLEDLIIAYVGTGGPLRATLDEVKCALLLDDPDNRLGELNSVNAFPTLLQIDSDLSLRADAVLGGPSIERFLGLS